LKARNPQMFQTIQQLRQNDGNPIDFFKQVTNKYTPEQMNNLFEKATQMGIPSEYIEQVKQGINAK